METGKEGDAWRETRDEKQVKTQKKHPGNQAAPDSAGDMKGNQYRDPENWTPLATRHTS